MSVRLKQVITDQHIKDDDGAISEAATAPDSAQVLHVFHTQLHIAIGKTHIRFLIQLSLHAISLSSSKLCAFAAGTSGQPTLI